MVYPDKHFYVVDSFGLGSNETGNWGFAVGLDPKYAKRFYEGEITGEQVKNLNILGKKIIRGIFEDERDSIINPYNFIKNKKGNSTFLLQFCNDDMRGCSLGIDGHNISSVLRWDDEFLVGYDSHNVDSPMQASGLLALWTRWAHSAYSMIK